MIAKKKSGKKMKKIYSKSIFLCAVLFGGCTSISSPNAQQYFLTDAENFAKIIENGQNPNAQTLQTQYIDKGTEGIKIFTEGRIEDAQKLSKEVSKNFAQYQYAVKTCLPAARAIEDDAGVVLRKVANTLGEKDIAPTYILFGANNSGGHGDARGFAIGLEVVCRGDVSFEDAKKNMLGLIAHEIVHVYQARHPPKEPNYNLLFMAIAEGGPDFVAELATGNSLAKTSEYGKFGAEHEEEIWRDFKKDLESGGKLDGNDWFYSKGRNNRPNDLGYFIGRRICEEYYKNSPDKQQALKEIISLQNPSQILEQSGYGKNWN